jgi:hypothetical protein
MTEKIMQTKQKVNSNIHLRISCIIMPNSIQVYGVMKLYFLCSFYSKGNLNEAEMILLILYTGNQPLNFRLHLHI